MKILSILLVLILPFVGYSQNHDLLGYSVGFMSDYMGRRITKGDSINDYSIDDFLNRKNIHDLLRLDTLLKTYNSKNDNIQYKITKDKSDYTLISKKLSDKINDYYNFEKDKLNSNKDIGRFTGQLKINKIMLSNKSFQTSFLAGSFYRYGDVDSLGYYYKFGNSINKLKVVKQLLNKYDCRITKEFDNQVEGLAVAPLIVTIYFVPTEELKKIFDYELNLKKKLKNTHANTM